MSAQRDALPQHGRWLTKRDCSGENKVSANPDFRDLFSIFNEENVEYLVAGAHAVIYFSEPRYTKDLDIWVNPTPGNAARVWRALSRFGAPLQDISEGDFQDVQLIYQIGVEPNRIDIIMGVLGVEFEDAWINRETSTYAGVPIYIMGKQALIEAKQASGRPQDLLDLAKLRDTHEEG
jgi:hypothetical protein